MNSKTVTSRKFQTDFLCKTERFCKGSVTKGRQICQEFLQSGNGDTDLQIEFKQENGTETVNESDINETTTTTSRVIEQNSTKHDSELPGFLLAESDPALIKILIDKAKPENLKVFLKNSSFTLHDLEDIIDI